MTFLLLLVIATPANVKGFLKNKFTLAIEEPGEFVNIHW